LREELGKVEDFSMAEMYERLSVYKHGIILESLNRFLTVNGFYTRLTDTDAILRRFDHNANQALDYAEFHELCTGQDISEKEDKKEESVDKEADEEEDQKVKVVKEEITADKRVPRNKDVEVEDSEKSFMSAGKEDKAEEVVEEAVEMKRQDLDDDAPEVDVEVKQEAEPESPEKRYRAQQE